MNDNDFHDQLWDGWNTDETTDDPDMVWAYRKGVAETLAKVRAALTAALLAEWDYPRYALLEVAEELGLTLEGD